MLFNSQEFLFIFLPATLVLYYFSASNVERRGWILVAASWIFYGYWDIRFLPLLIGSIGVNWALGQLHRSDLGYRTLAVGVPLNLAVLAYFKYFDFFGANLSALFGMPYDPHNIILPIGISFFTFQQISYLVDLSHNRAPAYGLRHYALYISFFPQLVAGPIVRHDELIPQFDPSPLKPGLWENLAAGSALLTIGVAKKVLLADRLAPHVDAVFTAAKASAVTTLDAWTATSAFSLQIYFDFSAYSDMAIGLALMFGLRLPVNFAAPYQAASLQEFWRRWHMTLSRFIRDYVYFPLGGSREGAARHAAALLVAMALCGFWHGAGWTFLLWGVLHGMGLVVNSAWHRLGRPLYPVVGLALTLAFVLFSWVLFRAETLAAAGARWSARVGLNAENTAIAVTKELASLQFVAGWAIVLLSPPSQQIVVRWLRPWSVLGLAFGIGLAALALELGKGKPVEFIYFAF